MPVSTDPPPADDEVECANCGAYIPYELTRCPKCGVNLYEPDEDIPESGKDRPRKPLSATPRPGGLLGRVDEFFHWLTNRPYPADELFGTAINQAEMFDRLLLKVGGDRPTAERLVDYERQKHPQGNRLIWIQNAIRRWEKDNKSRGG